MEQQPQKQDHGEIIKSTKSVGETLKACLEASKEKPDKKAGFYRTTAEQLLELGDTDKSFDLMKMAQEIENLEKRQEQIDKMFIYSEQIENSANKNLTASQGMMEAADKNRGTMLMRG